MVEFALVGIPLIFILISIFEISRGMWMYETVAHAVRDGARYAAVHGQDCATVPNSCAVNISDIAAVIKNAGAGLDPDQFTVTISTAVGTATLATTGASTLTALGTNTSGFSGWTYVPAGGGSASATGPGNDVIVSGQFPFKSALAMFWPGGGKVTFSIVNLGATSRERIDF
jgi:Flp pilus assembly protein TadG